MRLLKLINPEFSSIHNLQSSALPIDLVQVALRYAPVRQKSPWMIVTGFHRRWIAQLTLPWQKTIFSESKFITFVMT